MKNKPERNTKSRLLYLDILRIVACLLVIGVHVSSVWIYAYSAGSFGFACSMFWNALSSIGPMVFFMLSGIVFLEDTAPDIPISRLWYKNILRLLCAYLFWSCAYTVRAWWGYYPLNAETLRLFINEIFLGSPMYHLWFIPALISIYVILPVLRPAFSKLKNCRYFVIYYLVLSYLIPLIIDMDPTKEKLAGAAFSRFSFISLGLYVFMFVLGKYLYSEKIILPVRLALYAAGLILFAGTVHKGISASASEQGVTLSCWADVNFPIMVFIAAFVLFFVSMQKRVGRGPVFRGKADKLNGVIPALSKLTFGIYLIHPMFLGVFNDLFRKVLPSRDHQDACGGAGDICGMCGCNMGDKQDPRTE